MAEKVKSKPGATEKTPKSKASAGKSAVSKKEQRAVDRKAFELKPIVVICSDGSTFRTLSTFGSKSAGVEIHPEHGLPVVRVTSDPYNSSLWTGEKTQKVDMHSSAMKRFRNLGSFGGVPNSPKADVEAKANEDENS